MNRNVRKLLKEIEAEAGKAFETRMRASRICDSNPLRVHCSTDLWGATTSLCNELLALHAAVLRDAARLEKRDV